jgi:hypothetical protein
MMSNHLHDENVKLRTKVSVLENELTRKDRLQERVESVSAE